MVYKWHTVGYLLLRKSHDNRTLFEIFRRSSGFYLN